MFRSFDEIAQFNTVPAAAAKATKGWQEIASQTSDYAKSSFEKGRVHVEKLVGVKTLDQAVRLQTEFATAAYEDFLAQATKIGKLYSDLTQETFNLPMNATSTSKSQSAQSNTAAAAKQR
jgi:hypothetical protein